MEIERKWLCGAEIDLESSVSIVSIQQGYLPSSEVDSEARIRLVDSARAILTVKRVSSRGDVGKPVVREELEVSVPVNLGLSLLALCGDTRLEKVRHTMMLDTKMASVDVYSGRHAGLRVVEVEFESRSEAMSFDAPGWFGEEITGKEAYANRVLAADSGYRRLELGGDADDERRGGHVLDCRTSPNADGRRQNIA